MWCAKLIVKCEARSLKQQKECIYSDVNKKCRFKNKNGFCENYETLLACIRAESD